MKLLYATSLTFPSGLANRLQILAMSREFALKLKNNFYLGVGIIGAGEKIKENNSGINIIDFKTARSYILALKYWQLIRQEKIGFVYCREPRLLFLLIILSRLFFLKKVKFIYEVHEISSRSWLDKFMSYFFSQTVDYIIFITRKLQEIYLKKYKYQEERTLVAPDGVDLVIFDLDLTLAQAREKLELPLNKKIIGYFGRFKTMGMDKGLGTILAALKLLDEDIILLAMGGKPRDIASYRQMAQELGVEEKVLLVEHLNQHEVALRQKACDALLMPFPYNEHYAFFMSPLKMFEYMAAGRPIIASNLPSIREILNERNAILVTPGDHTDLKRGITKILRDNDLATKLSSQAFKDIQNYTWERRTETILSFLK